MNNALVPVVDIIEMEKFYNIQIELPGLKENEIELHIDGGNLVLKGKRKQENKGQIENILVHESSHGAFYRSFPLPNNVDPKQEYKGKLRSGILSIKLYKLKAKKSKIKQISIKSK